jgi:hypothetical protein
MDTKIQTVVSEQLKIYNKKPTPQNMERLQEVIGFDRHQRGVKLSMDIIAYLSNYCGVYDDHEIELMQKALDLLEETERFH